MGRRKKKKGGEAVELNLAAMLDMAFQLLTFFILTFKPAPVEGQIAQRLPPPQAVAGKTDSKPAGDNDKTSDAPAPVSTLLISVFSDPQTGDIAGMAIGENGVTLKDLDGKLKEIFAANTPFEQVLIQVHQDLMYDKLMKVIEICAKQKLPDGSKLSKLSFVELPEK